MKFLILCFALLLSSSAFAQEPAATPVDPAALVAEVPVDPAITVTAEAVRLKLLNEPFKQSFLFTPLELAMIARANAGKPASTALLQAGNPQYIPPRRIISLAGVLFRKQGDWIVWLNGRKVVPKQLLPEIIDIEVKNDLVHLKWFDIGMNKIISISLRPHQTYDIVTGMLLPG